MSEQDRAVGYMGHEFTISGEMNYSDELMSKLFKTTIDQRRYIATSPTVPIEIEVTAEEIKEVIEKRGLTVENARACLEYVSNQISRFSQEQVFKCAPK